MTDKQRRLGRGLEALLGGSSSAPARSVVSTDGPRDLPVELIRPNPFQPRRDFSVEELSELQASMRASGLLQPIVVRPVGDSYELIAGERRLRAARQLQWSTIPTVVRHYEDKEMLTLALIENLQRADLNPIEEADGYERLIQEFSLTQQQVADAVGKDRSTVANLLRLRQLPQAVRELVRNGRLSVGHARALLALPPTLNLVEVTQRVLAENLTVRDVERLARPTAPADSTVSSNVPARQPAPATTAEVRNIVDRLRRTLQTDVAITANTRSEGEIRIRFFSADDLDRLATIIAGSEP